MGPDNEIRFYESLTRQWGIDPETTKRPSFMQVQQELENAKKRLTNLKSEFKTRGMTPVLPEPNAYLIINRFDIFGVLDTYFAHV